MAELAQGLGFNLTDAFAGNVEYLADLFQGALVAVIQAEAQAQRSSSTKSISIKVYFWASACLTLPGRIGKS